MVWCDVVWPAVLCGVVLCVVMYCAVVWCGILHGIVWYCIVYSVKSCLFWKMLSGIEQNITKDSKSREIRKILRESTVKTKTICSPHQKLEDVTYSTSSLNILGTRRM